MDRLGNNRPSTRRQVSPPKEALQTVAFILVQTLVKEEEVECSCHSPGGFYNTGLVCVLSDNVKNAALAG